MEHMLNSGIGQFDITVTGGKQKDTARQETVEVLQSVMPLLPPEMAAKAAGTLVRNIDGPGMLELADQLAPDEGSGMIPVEQLKQFQQQAQQLIQEAEQKIGELERQIASKRDELTAKMQIAEKENAAKVAMKDMELRANVQLEEVKQQGETERAMIAAQASVRSAALQPNPSPELGR